MDIRAGMIRELVMIRDGLWCFSGDVFASEHVHALICVQIDLILFYFILNVYLVYDFYINNTVTDLRGSLFYIVDRPTIVAFVNIVIKHYCAPKQKLHLQLLTEDTRQHFLSQRDTNCENHLRCSCA